MISRKVLQQQPIASTFQHPDTSVWSALAIPNPLSSINILEPDNLWLYSIMPKQPNDGFIRYSTAVGQQKMSPALPISKKHIS
jgi:hypothetical protein